MKVRRRSPDTVVGPRLVCQRRQEFVVPIAVPLFLLFRSQLELGVGLIDQLLRYVLEPDAGRYDSLSQRATIGGAVVEVLRFLQDRCRSQREESWLP